MLDVVDAHPGRYLVAFPSYAYLAMFSDALATDERSRGVHFFDQESARESLLDELHQAPLPVLAGIVLGGLFAESVDFSALQLTGVVVVGVALPPPALERDLRADHFRAKGLDGQLLAYLQPGMTKVVQAAGRLIRSPAHRGVLVLVDQRYTQSAFRQFFPALWQPRQVSSHEVPELVGHFWKGGQGSGQERGNDAGNGG